VVLPANFASGDLPALRHMRAQLANGTAVRDTPTLPFAVTEDEARVIIALTYGMIAMVDDAVGRLIDLIGELGMAEDTVLIFTADHGDYMADHGLMTKYLLHYRSLIRVPFIIADPQGAAGRSRSDLTSTIDIAPTILARAGLAPFNGMQGRDLSDATMPAPASLLIEEDSPVPMYGEGAPQRVRTLVTERWRLSHHHGPGWWELYDLRSDPDENVNLWERAEARDVTESLTRAMVARMTALQDTSPLPTGRA
jgi:arylsulfatase A-like enzyme